MPILISPLLFLLLAVTLTFLSDAHPVGKRDTIFVSRAAQVQQSTNYRKYIGIAVGLCEPLFTPPRSLARITIRMKDDKTYKSEPADTYSGGSRVDMVLCQNLPAKEAREETTRSYPTTGE